MTNSKQNTKAEAIVLWGVGPSPFVRKVQIALEEKGLAYKHMQILPKVLLTATGQPVPATFDKVSPLGKIPALQIGDYAIADSAVISAYLDKKFPQGQKLYPEQPEAYARALWFENYADTIFSSITHKKILVEAVVKPNVLGIKPDQEALERARTEDLPPCLDYLEQEVSKHDWIAGDEFSMADVAIVTQLICLEQASFYLSNTRWKHLCAYKDKVMARDSFKKIQ
jgi:glutathione S-transferase